MSYEPYKKHRLAPDDNGCWSVLTDPGYEQVGTYPSKAAAKRAIDEIEVMKSDQSNQTIEQIGKLNTDNQSSKENT